MKSTTTVITITAMALSAHGATAAGPPRPAWGEVPLRGRGVISLVEFEDRVVDAGGENEDWQPAFQAAISAAYETGRTCIHVPAGRYPVRTTITIPPTPWRGFGFGALRFVGDGRTCTRIEQQDDEANVIDWSGPAYKESMAGGTMENLALNGGKIGLNIKWHNNFTMRCCYVAGAETGIYAEGWSSNFIEVIVRWCRKVGIHGRAHFNNITIRDGYMSRVGTGIYIQGGNGIRIHGYGIEGATSTAIRLGGAKMVAIRDCYFECDGMARTLSEGYEIEDTYPSSVYLAPGCRAITIEGCIFRCTGVSGGHIGLVECLRGSIRDNLFQLLESNSAVCLRSLVHKGRERHRLQDVVVEGNFFRRAERQLREGLSEQPEVWYTQEKAEYLAAAQAAGCRFEGGADRMVLRPVEPHEQQQKHVAPQE